MPKKIKIDIDFSSDNTLLAVSFQKKDYTLAYNLNKTLKTKLEKIKDLPYYEESLEKILEYSLFHYFDSDCHLSFYLLSNHHAEGKLFRAFKTIDFFILIHGSLDDDAVSKIVKEIKSIQGVLTAFLPDMKSVKDYSLFLSDLELHMVEVLKG
jgi:hypothetical protein